MTIPDLGGDPSVVVVSASIGAGHDGAASELSHRLRAAGFAVRREDFLDLLPPGWGDRLRAAYAAQLRHAPATWGWLLRAVGGRRLAAGASALTCAAAADRVLAATGPRPAAVVSTYPLASQALGWLRRADRLHAPVIAVMTDPSVHPLCAAAGADLHLAPTEHAATQLRDRHGVPAAAVSPIVDPAFRPGEAGEARRRLGLPLRERLAVVVAGSWGVGEVAATVRDIHAIRTALPVVVCGRNDALRDKLSAAGDAMTLGWVDDMPSLLRAADVVVHNAGGLSSLEAMATGVPVISYRCLPGHGVANAAVLEATGLAAWPRGRDDLAAALQQALHGDLGPRQRRVFARLGAAPDAAAIIGGLARLTGATRETPPAEVTA